MTDDDPTGDSTDEPFDEPRDGGWLASLLDALDRHSSSGRRGRRLDYDVSVRTGLDAIEARREASDGRPPGRRPSGTRPSAAEPRPAPAGADRYNVTTQRHVDELIVTADVAGVDPDDVTVGFDGHTLVVAVDGRRLERVELPWRESTAEATVNNGILTVRARPDTDE